MDIVTSGAVTWKENVSDVLCRKNSSQARSGGKMTETSSGDCRSQQLESAVVTDASQASKASFKAGSTSSKVSIGAFWNCTMNKLDSAFSSQIGPEEHRGLSACSVSRVRTSHLDATMSDDGRSCGTESGSCVTLQAKESLAGDG